MNNESVEVGDPSQMDLASPTTLNRDVFPSHKHSMRGEGPSNPSHAHGSTDENSAIIAPELRRSSRAKKKPEKLGYEGLGVPTGVTKTVPGLLATIEDNLHYQDAISGGESVEWKCAISAELNSLQENNTWSLQPLPRGKKIIGSMWLFKKKDLPDGKIKYKARLVAKGYTQVEGRDYNETYAPVLKYQSLRMILALANEEDMHVHQMDVTTAFLYGELEEEIYLEQPEGQVAPGQEQMVCRLHKSLYGLKQSPRCWNSKIHAHLLKLGFAALKTDSDLYQKGADKVKLIIALYVDDILILSESLALVLSTKASLSSEFKMTDSGEVDVILGLKVTRNREMGILQLGQELYAEKILSRFNLNLCEGRSTPLPQGIKLSNDQMPSSHKEIAAMKDVPYREAVGCLMYLMISTRPDIAAAVQFVSRFGTNPGPQHWEAVKHIFKYVHKTKHLQLTFKKQGVINLQGFSDSDWESCQDTRRSTSGYIFKLGGAAISWCSRRQKTVSLSSCEAEYVAACEATREAVWETAFLEELGYQGVSPTIIYMDSQSAMQLISNPVFHDKTKHIQGKMHFVREMAEEGLVAFVKVHTSENTAELLTKSVNAEKTIFCRRQMGLLTSQDFTLSPV
jgi:hypothetical protein